MCLAYPGKIESIDGDHAIVNFSGIKRKTNIAYVKAKIGDYVIVHAGFAIEILNKKVAEDAIAAMSK